MLIQLRKGGFADFTSALIDTNVNANSVKIYQAGTERELWVEGPQHNPEAPTAFDICSAIARLYQKNSNTGQHVIWQETIHEEAKIVARARINELKEKRRTTSSPVS